MPGAFSLHPDLPRLTVAQLEWYHQRYLERRDRATALVLARLAAIGVPRFRQDQGGSVSVDAWSATVTPAQCKPASNTVFADIADTEGADWREVARIVLHIDPERADRARRAFDSHLSRTKWMSDFGYKFLLRHGWPRST